MAFDIIILVILIASAVYYMRKGFALSIMSILEWFTACAVSLCFCDNISSLLRKSGMGKALKRSLEDRLLVDATPESPIGSVQAIFYGWLGNDSEIVSDITATNACKIFFAVISFLMLALLVKALLRLAMQIFHREKNSEFFNFLDTLGGLTMGVVIGVFYALLLLLLLFGLMPVLPAGTAESAMRALDHSFFSGSMYIHNFLIRLLYILSL